MSANGYQALYLNNTADLTTYCYWLGKHFTQILQAIANTLLMAIKHFTQIPQVAYNTANGLERSLYSNTTGAVTLLMVIMHFA
jgi:hypothetical protein